MSLHKKPKTINPDEVDPSVYYYDEVYDDMKEEEETARHKDNSRSKKNGEKSSKYIQGLLETADQRKAEKEMRKFKKYARDREEAEAEGLLDKTEVYITPAYEKKLKEISRISHGIGHRLKEEEGRVMNFSKSDSKDQDIVRKKSDNKSVEDNSSTISEIKVPNKEDKQAEQGSGQQQADSTFHQPTPKRKMKTPEGRLEYLQKVLAKRTVGEAFKEAQERFRQRKSMTQR